VRVWIQETSFLFERYFNTCYSNCGVFFFMRVIGIQGFFFSMFYSFLLEVHYTQKNYYYLGKKLNITIFYNYIIFYIVMEGRITLHAYKIYNSFQVSRNYIYWCANVNSWVNVNLRIYIVVEQEKSISLSAWLLGPHTHCQDN